MNSLDHFKNVEQELLPMQYDRAAFYGILSFWREYDPGRVEELLFKRILRRTLKQTANDLSEMQLALEKSELLPPALAQNEAWRSLMRIEETEDEADREADWGPWREEYINLLYKH